MTQRVDYSEIAQQYIRELVSEFVSNPYNFFSESDIKCRLFNMMFRNNEMSRLGITMDGKQIHPLHSEVTYFNHENKLLYHVDLSAVNPEETDVYSSPKTEGLRLSKGYSALECLFAIELKLNKRYRKEKMLDLWKKDAEKLDDILIRNPLLKCFCILLDKKNRISEQNELTILATNHPGIKLIYVNTQGLTFPRDLILPHGQIF